MRHTAYLVPPIRTPIASRRARDGKYPKLVQPAFETMRKRLDDKMKNPTYASGTPSNLDELEKLASLRDKGIVTEEEFESKKRQLLELQ